jgi:hypothetical protein
MRRLSYAGGFLDTSDAIAGAVLDYAAILANHDRADTIHVPAIGLPEGAETVELLIGPASQLVSTPIDDARDDPAAEAFLAELGTRTERLEHRYVVPRSPMDWEL